MGSTNAECLAQKQILSSRRSVETSTRSTHRSDASMRRLSMGLIAGSQRFARKSTVEFEWKSGRRLRRKYMGGNKNLPVGTETVNQNGHRNVKVDLGDVKTGC